MRRSTSPACVAPSTSRCSATGAQPGEWVLIHVGFALSRIDEQEAHATLQLLREAGGEFDQAIDELRTSAIE